jgi:ribosomal protein L11 methylase PrmA
VNGREGRGQRSVLMPSIWPELGCASCRIMCLILWREYFSKAKIIGVDIIDFGSIHNTRGLQGVMVYIQDALTENFANFLGKFDIVIDPKMSFGTGHHDTTMLMIEEVLKLKMQRKRLLDMGCGTGVLAILAAKMDAEKIVAIDNEEWAYRNAMENCANNHCQQIFVIHGNATDIPNSNFDYILANINKNILLADMEQYYKHLSSDGRLLISGFFVHDIPQLKAHAEGLGLKLLTQVESNSWACMVFEKK